MTSHVETFQDRTFMSWQRLPWKDGNLPAILARAAMESTADVPVPWPRDLKDVGDSFNDYHRVAQLAPEY